MYGVALNEWPVLAEERRQETEALRQEVHRLREELAQRPWWRRLLGR